MEKILTLEEVAKILKVSERTVVDWAQKDDLPGGKIGTTWRFKESEIQHWLDSKLTPRIQKSAPVPDSLVSLLYKDQIALYDFDHKNEILNALIDTLQNAKKIVNRNEVANAIFAREEMMSTGIGLGIAVPHCRLNAISDISIAVGINKKPLSDYESLDGLPVQIVIMVIAGRNQHSEYIRILSLFSKRLKDNSVREQLLSAENAQEIYTILVSG